MRRAAAVAAAPEALLVLARHPERGRVKRRLARGIGEAAALRVYRGLLARTMRLALAPAASAGRRATVFVAPPRRLDDFRRRWARGLPCLPQPRGNLGVRLARAFLLAGARRTVAIGTDCPGLAPRHLDRAFRLLRRHPAVLGPAEDGGYYLIGLSRPAPGVFRRIDWGTERVLAQTRRRLASAGLRPALLEVLRDVDRPSDLA